ncbi:MAG: hypothetical protein C5B53_01045 [Candidatus Melainabacteria bacterium]|nr:MAG: hypothetical protein C5B53_01045 [Candidatus Melainabacteria bacterium]
MSLAIKSPTYDLPAETLRGFCAQLNERGRQTAIVSFAAETREKLTFHELWQAIKSVSAGLLKDGLQKGDKVILLAANSTHLIISALAVIEAGGVCVPVDSQSDDEALKHILKDSGAKRLFVDEKGLQRYERLGRSKKLELVRLDDPAQWRHMQAKAKEEGHQLDANDEAVLFYTSGTTGPPKGVPLTHGNIVTQLDAVLKMKLVRPTDRILLPLPLFHVYPFVIGLLVPLSLGVPVILPKSVTGPDIVKATKEGEATLLVSVPRLLRAMYSAIEAKARANNISGTTFDIATRVSGFFRGLNLNLGHMLFKPVHKQFPKLRLLACGGAILEPELAHNLMALGWDIAVGYGLTETSPLLTIRLPENRDIESVGKPVPGVQLRLQKVEELSEDNANSPDSQASDENLTEVQAKGPNIFSGYHNLPEKTAECFTQDGWFKTGDIGYVKHGNLHVAGRINIMMKSEGGKKIQPEEVEKKYSDDPAIREIGVLENKQKLVALVVPNLKSVGKDGTRDKIAEVIRKKSESIPSYYRVVDFALTRELLPRTNLGKIRRQELAERYEKAKKDEAANKGAISGAKTELSSQDKAILEEPVAKACWDWLQEKFPDAGLTFDKSPQLDLNIDSLEWLNLTLEMHERFGAALSEEAIARIDTVRDLLNEVVNASRSGDANSSLFEHPEKLLDDSQKKWLKPLNPIMFSIAYVLYWCNYFLMRLAFRVSAEGAERIPEGQVVFTPNHASYLDAFALCSVLSFDELRKTQFAGWAGIALANPFNAFMYRLVQAIPIEAKRSLISSLALAVAVLKKGRNLVWFPEGERTLTGDLLPFKSGVGMLLHNVPVKVVPVFISGTREALPPGAFFPNFSKITVVFGKAVQPKTLARSGSGNSEPERIAKSLHDRVDKLKIDTLSHPD